jgi:serine/threonine-protein kinase
LLLRVSAEVTAAKQQIIVDNRRTENKEWGTPIPVDPGAHRVRSMAEDGNVWESEVNVPAGGTMSLDIPLLRPRGAPAPTPEAGHGTPAPEQAPKQDPGKTQRTVGLVVGAVGVVGIGLGTFFGLRAKSKQDESNAAGDPSLCNADDKCGPAGLDLRQSALGSATAATVFFILGGVAIAGGAVLYVTAPKASKTTAGIVVAPTLGGASVRASF